MIRCYKDLVRLRTFEERFKYLKLDGVVGNETFGYDRYLNQAFYRSEDWRQLRKKIILRDEGCDLGVIDKPIKGRIYIHHMNPITQDDLVNKTDYLLNPDFLICVSKTTHDAIHYSDESLLPSEPAVRKPFDTCPWKVS